MGRGQRAESRDDGGDGEKAEEKAYLEIAGEARAREDFDRCTDTNKQLWWRGRGRGGTFV
jgi:hypothetical protein